MFTLVNTALGMLHGPSLVDLASAVLSYPLSVNLAPRIRAPGDAVKRPNPSGLRRASSIRIGIRNPAFEHAQTIEIWVCALVGPLGDTAMFLVLLLGPRTVAITWTRCPNGGHKFRLLSSIRSWRVLHIRAGFSETSMD